MAIERISNLIKNITSEKLNLSTGTMVNFITEFNRKADATLESIKENILNATQKSVTLLIASKGKSRKYIEETGI